MADCLATVFQTKIIIPIFFHRSTLINANIYLLKSFLVVIIGMMKTSRQLVLEFIRNQRSITAADLSRALHMTTANARHHLTILEDQGAIRVIGLKSSPGRGRPSKVYALNTSVGRNNLGRLVTILLTEFKDSLDFKKLAACFTGEIKESRRSLTERLMETIQRLNELNYDARWEARSEAPWINFSHCPYQAIVDQHPELCMMDQYMISKISGARVQQVAKLVSDNQGGKICSFRLQVG